MRPLSAAQLLALWDAGQTRHPIDRALLALALAMPEQAPDELADRPVGWREVNLLALRNATFGHALDGYAACPSCGALMEFSLDGKVLLDGLPAPAPDVRIVVGTQQWRLPSSRDQAAILDAPDPDTAVEWLVDRCRIAENSPGNDLTVNRKKSQKSKSSPALLGELEARMEALDPAADIRLAMNCTDCGHVWDAVLDIGACFWEEVTTRARQLLESVHRLASAYGWREADILALSPARRAAYLSMIG
ncbi:MAG: phage baseplate protein [Proteobacteria bacterium]|nr:phage baseplate protein [Pseudomonadota bacterium]